MPSSFSADRPTTGWASMLAAAPKDRSEPLSDENRIRVIRAWWPLRIRTCTSAIRQSSRSNTTIFFFSLPVAAGSPSGALATPPSWVRSIGTPAPPGLLELGQPRPNR